MQNVIVGTAGHVDHGKTCLIKALSGIDTDRLKEEKKRGITIELGFANLIDTDGVHIGIIDVPGHEKFVKNMLAGIGGIDLVLLVVALDEGVMPQTVEHFEILKMLQIRQGIVVLTKSDTVDSDWADMVEEDVRELIKGSFLEQAELIRVSSYTGENIDVLRQKIVTMAKQAGKRREEKELFRLPIDRVFTMEGFGTVVTGTLVEGMCEAGEEVMVYPQERLLKIRGVQSHGQKEEKASAGQRTAINLAGIKKEELSRGQVLAYPGSLVNSTMVDATLRLFDSTQRKLKNGDRVHLSYGSAQAIGKVILLDCEVVEAGQEALVQIRFDDPICVKRNDKFIIRFYSPVETFGGGTILNPAADKHKRGQEDIIESLRLKKTGTDMEILEQRCFSVPWSRESILYDLSENHLAAYFVAELSGRVVGYIGVWKIVDEGHITNVAVSPDYRRMQIGSALLKTMLGITAEEGIVRHTLEVRTGNEAAIGLYEKFGFETAGVRKGYYEDNGEDALIMWRG